MRTRNCKDTVSARVSPGQKRLKDPHYQGLYLLRPTFASMPHLWHPSPLVVFHSIPCYRPTCLSEKLRYCSLVKFGIVVIFSLLFHSFFFVAKDILSRLTGWRIWERTEFSHICSLSNLILVHQCYYTCMWRASLQLIEWIGGNRSHCITISEQLLCFVKLAIKTDVSWGGDWRLQKEKRRLGFVLVADAGLWGHPPPCPLLSPGFLHLPLCWILLLCSDAPGLGPLMTAW